MTKAELKDKIGEQIERNLYYISRVVTNDNVRHEFENNIRLLHEASIMMDAIAVALAPNEDDYNRGLNDAWELARKIVSLSPQEGGYSCHDMLRIFGHSTLREISDQYTVQEALSKSQEYEKKKAEEEAKLVPGDVVKVTDKRDSSYNYGIYLGDDYYSHYILRRGNMASSLCTKDFYTLEKTGQHVDLEGWAIDD